MSRSVQSPEALLACFLNIYHILLCHALLFACSETFARLDGQGLDGAVDSTV